MGSFNRMFQERQMKAENKFLHTFHTHASAHNNNNNERQCNIRVKVTNGLQMNEARCERRERREK